MSGFRVMAAFAAGATIAGMVVGVARLTDVVEPATAVADAEAEKPTPTPTSTSTATSSTSTSEPQQKQPPPGWHAPEGAPEEVTAGVLARVASRRAKVTGCEPARKVAAVERVERKERAETRRGDEAGRCPPDDGIESVEIDWNHGPTSTR
jgi:hypothetical protein